MSTETILRIDTQGVTSSNIPDDTFEIGTHPDFQGLYKYDVDWGDGSSNTNVTGNIKHNYSQPGEYDVKISSWAGGRFPALYQLATEGSKQKIIDVKEWGPNEWESFESFLEGNTVITGFSATDTPNLRLCTSFKKAFKGAENFDTDTLNKWDVKGIQNFFETFKGATSFNGELKDWSTSSAYIMESMFEDCTSFDKDLSSWAVERLNTKPYKFDKDATLFTVDKQPKWGVSIIEQKKRKTYTWRGFNTEFDFLTGFKANGFQVQQGPEYTWKINGGKGVVDLTVIGRVDEFFDFVNEEQPGFIQCLVHDRDTPAEGELIFQGTLLEATTKIDKNGHASISDVAYASGEQDLNQKQLEDVFTGDTRKQYVDEDISEVFKDIIELYWNKGSTTIVEYTPYSVKEVGQKISITFSDESYYEMMDRLTGFLPLGWYWYIDGEGIFYLDETDLFNPDHTVYIGREVNKVNVSVNFADIKNTIYFSGGETGNGDNLYRKYKSETSQLSFGVKEVRLDDGRVTNENTADLRASRYLRENSAPVRYIEFDVIDNNYNPYGYDIESLKPGDSISVLSGDITTAYTRYQDSAGDIGNGVYNESSYLYSIYSSIGVPFQIQEIQYKGDKVTIKSSDLISNQANTINQLRRQQRYERTKNNPGKPTDEISL